MNDFIKNNKFTLEQGVAVKNDYGNVLVSASAGSGKTKVLIGRIINLLLEKKCSVKDLLVVTFTNAASDEMRSRLKSELVKYNLLEELDEINNADIFNLHKFCSKLIKEFFFTVNLDTSFAVLAENESDYLLADCVDKCIIESVNDTEFQILLESYNKNRNYLDFKKTVFRIHKFLRSIENSTEWIHNVLENSFEVSNSNKALNFLNDYYINKIEDCINNFKMLKLESFDYEKISQACEDSIEVSKKYTNKNFLENFENLKIVLNLTSLYGKSKTEEEKGLRQKYSEIKKCLQAAIEDYKKAVPYSSLEELNFALQNNKNKVLKLVDFVNFVDSKYSILKQKLNSLDFNDLEHFALKILEDESIVCAVKNKYKYIFVDEYQDTNSVQEKILSLISSGDNLFMVGDVKQSIYGFRFCNPQIFIDKYNKFESSLSDTNFLVNLNKNFRSESAILNFCNFVFTGIMTDESCGINYSESSMFTSGKTVEKHEETQPLINIAVFEKEDAENDIALGLYDIKKERFEACESDLDKQIYFVATKIKELLDQDIFDDSINANRKIKYSDIAILSRNRSKTLERIANVFKQINIPISASYKTKLFESESVNLVLNYLRVLDNFYQDLPLYGVLNSFIFRLSEDELASIKTQTNTCKYFYESLQEFALVNKANGDLNNQAILNKLSVFLKEINKFTSNKEKLTLQELLNEIFTKHQIIEYYEQIGNLDGLQNIKMFLDFVKSSGFDSVQELLFYIDNFGSDKTFDKNIVDSENSVCLTTIHASKGLEYPIVFLIDMGNKFSNSTMREGLVMDLDLGLSTSHVNLEERTQKEVPTTKGIKLKKRQFEIQEEMRLLYVALTRAKNKLFLVGEFDLNKAKQLGSASDILSRTSYYSWILGALSENEIIALQENSKLIKTYSGCKFLFTVEDSNFENINTKDAPINIDFNVEFIQKYLNFTPQKCEEKLRYTVTEILQEEDTNQNNINYVFKLNSDKQEIDYSKLGTIYHEIMQKIKFESLSFMECKKEIPKLINFYKKSLKENEVIDKDQIEKAVYNLGEFLKVGDKVYKEVGFHLYESACGLNLGASNNKVAVQGVVDLIIERQNEIIILDYKTSRLKTAEDFVKKYGRQLDLYAKAVSKFFKKPVSKKIIYSFYLNGLIFV